MKKIWLFFVLGFTVMLYGHTGEMYLDDNHDTGVVQVDDYEGFSVEPTLTVNVFQREEAEAFIHERTIGSAIAPPAIGGTIGRGHATFLDTLVLKPPVVALPAVA